jgi:hypothetical protein
VLERVEWWAGRYGRAGVAVAGELGVRGNATPTVCRGARVGTIGAREDIFVVLRITLGGVEVAGEERVFAVHSVRNLLEFRRLGGQLLAFVGGFVGFSHSFVAGRVRSGSRLVLYGARVDGCGEAESLHAEGAAAGAGLRWKN